MPATAKSAGPVTVITRRQQPVIYASGAKQPIPLVRGMAYRYLVLHLTATPTLTAANNTVANTQPGDEWGCVSKIEVIANGQTTLLSVTGADLKQIARLLTGKTPRVLPTLGDATTANPVLDSTVVIPFLNPRSRRPLDTLLWTGEMSDLRLEITWTTDWTSINSAATAWTTQPIITPYTREQSLPTDANGVPQLPAFYRRMLRLPVTIAAANPSFMQQLNTGPIYRGLILNTQSGGVDDDTLLTNVKTFSGATTFFDEEYYAIHDRSNQVGDTASESFELSAGGFHQGHAAANAIQKPRAWTYIDFCDDGYMTEALDTSSIGDTFIEVNASKAGAIILYTQELLRINRGQ